MAAQGAAQAAQPEFGNFGNNSRTVARIKKVASSDPPKVDVFEFDKHVCKIEFYVFRLNLRYRPTDPLQNTGH